MEDNDTLEEREEELSSIAAIFPELEIDEKDPFCAILELAVEVATPLRICFPVTEDGNVPAPPPTPPCSEKEDDEKEKRNPDDAPSPEIHHLTYLPPIRLNISLPTGYPETEPPQFALSASVAWIPKSTLKKLQEEGEKLWEEYGRSQVVYGYIDFLQQAAERAFDLAENGSVTTVHLAAGLKVALLDYDKRAKRRKFEEGTYDCGVCLDPKRGSVCYQMQHCRHIFCISCLQDFYNNCIKEGDVANVRCMDPDCGKKPNDGTVARGKRKLRTLGPSELLQIPLEHTMVRRYIELKRKKKIEADKTTIYCPRKWCQGPARSTKYPKIVSLDNYVDSDSDGEEAQPIPDAENETQNYRKMDRIAVCENCEFAFCRVCLAGWHGDFVRCWPRTAAELSEDEQASYNYIRSNTSPCPTCNSPVQKTYGCNHMTCFQCRSHFCYLCSSWLGSGNPYAHFNKLGTPCYQRLWELQEGDEGQGAHFDGPRALEIAQIEALQADLAEEEEANGAANDGAEAPAQGDRGRAREEAEDFVAALNRLNIEQPAGADRRPRAAGGRNVNGDPMVRGAHAPARAPRPARQGHLPRHDNGLQRFIQMAQNDEEDGWDSDELDDDDGEFANFA